MGILYIDVRSKEYCRFDPRPDELHSRKNVTSDIEPLTSEPGRVA